MNYLFFYNFFIPTILIFNSVFWFQTVAQIQRALGEGFSINKTKAEVQVVIARYKDLDDATKQELKDAFPVVTTIVDSKFPSPLLIIFIFRPSFPSFGDRSFGRSRQLMLQYY